jgi:hypothetical protein
MVCTTRNAQTRKSFQNRKLKYDIGDRIKKVLIGWADNHTLKKFLIGWANNLTWKKFMFVHKACMSLRPQEAAPPFLTSQKQQ